MPSASVVTTAIGNSGLARRPLSAYRSNDPWRVRESLGGPVDTRPRPNKFKGLRLLRLRIEPEQRPANCAPALMGSLDGSEGGAPMQWRAGGRDTRCRDSRKATQDNQTPGRANASLSHSFTGAPWVPVRAAVANEPGGGGWIPVPFWGAGPPAFLLVGRERTDRLRVFRLGIANYGTHNSARPLSEYRHHGAHRCR